MIKKGRVIKAEDFSTLLGSDFEAKADKSLTLTAGTGLTGGGNLSANRIFSFDTTWGDSRYALSARTITAGDGLTGGGTLAANRSFSVDSTVVRTTRNLVAGTGITGGGTLAADRTFSFDTIWGDARYALSGHTHSNFALNTVSISAGTGLTGGGTLAANRTISFDTTWGDGRYAGSGHNHDSAYAPLSHVGATGTAHGAVTTSVNGFMTSAMLTKLNGIETGAINKTTTDGLYPSQSISITAGNGLSGGGTLAANRTITLGTPGTLNASSTNSVTTTSHTHSIEVATKAEAETGSNNTKLVTPLRVKEAIDSMVTTEFVNHLSTNSRINTDLISSYPIGLSVMRSDTTQGYPFDWGNILTARPISLRGWQIAIPNDGIQRFRAQSADGAWQAWQTVETTDGAQSKIDSKNIVAGNGLSGGGLLSGTGTTLTLGTPGTLTASSTNAVTATSHTHNIDIATKAEAEVGSNNTKLVTPLRVKEAIDVLAQTVKLTQNDGKGIRGLTNVTDLTTIRTPGFYYMTTAESATMTDHPRPNVAGWWLNVGSIDASSSVVQELIRNSTSFGDQRYWRVVTGTGSSSPWYQAETPEGAQSKVDTKNIVAGNGLSGGGLLAGSGTTITLGTPGTLTASTTNSVTATSHTHAINIASKAGAESGTDSTNLMTPLRTKEAIDKFATSELVNLLTPSSQTATQGITNFPLGITVMRVLDTDGYPVSGLLTTRRNGTLGHQTLIQSSSDFRAYTRYCNTNGVWTSWSENTSVVDMGSNSNGSYVRYSDGRQECWSSTGTITVNSGINSDTVITYPASFAYTPRVVLGQMSGGIITQLYYRISALSLTTFTLNVHNMSPSQRYAMYYYYAVGWWK